MNKNIFLGLLALLFSFGASAQLRAAAIFGNHMVLQRNAPINIWGWAKPGQQVSLVFDKQTKTAVADKSGKWKTALDKHASGGPYTMKIFTAKEKIDFSDVLVGEVWVASGQSNMEWSVAQSMDAAQEMAAANYPQIRQIDIPNRVGFSPKDDFEKQPWVVCSPQSVGPFSGVAYFFAKKLYNELKVPIGIINSTWGGTMAEAWTSSEALATHPDFKAQVANRPLSADGFGASMKKITDAIINNFQKPIADNNEQHWKNLDYDDSQWNTLQEPGAWEQQGLAGFDGEVWFRKYVEFENDLGGDAKIFLGTIDDNDETYINGTLVGKTNAWDKQRVYNVPAGVLHKGKNLIAVKVYDTGGDGGFYGKNPMKLSIGDEEIKLEGAWKARVWKAQQDATPQPNNLLSSLYNAMLHPLIPYTIKGAIWYQGESNAARAKQYETLFPLMIKDWRNKWKLGNFPFYFVQLASFDPQHKPIDMPGEWPDLRYAQTKALALPNTGMVVTTDVGNVDDIHPINKQTVGLRLANIALKNLYGFSKVVAVGPKYQSYQIAGNRLWLNFSQSLSLRDGNIVKGFVWLDDKGKALEATAEIKGSKVLLEIPKGVKATAIRYAWHDNASEANIINAAGLPAEPFSVKIGF